MTPRLGFRWSELRERGEMSFEFLMDLDRTDPEAYRLFTEFAGVHMRFMDLNPDPHSGVIVWASLWVVRDGAETDYVVGLDWGMQHDWRQMRRSVLHELRHVWQDRQGLDLTGTSANRVSDLQDYWDNPLEADAIEHEVVSRWFR